MIYFFFLINVYNQELHFILGERGIEMTFIFNSLSTPEVWLWVAIATFIIPVVTLSIIVLIKIIIKQLRISKKATSKVDYLPIFGGLDNVNSVKRTETRIAIEVKSLDLVDIDGLRQLNVGAMIIGNTIKCSSLSMAEQLEHIKK